MKHRRVKSKSHSKFFMQLLIILLFVFTTLNANENLCQAKRLIGATTEVTLLDLNLGDIKAKVDTGAYTSSIDCSEITVNSFKNIVTFIPLNETKRVNMPISRISSVKSSNGAVERRPFIMLNIKINGCLYKTEFSLTSRSGMKYPILIGRQLLKNNFLVDVSIDE